MKNNPDLLQEDEVVNYDAYVTADAGKYNEDSDNINTSMEEEHKTVEYQDTLKVYVKNIARNRRKIWRQIYEVIDAPYFEEIENLPQDF